MRARHFPQLHDVFELLVVHLNVDRRQPGLDRAISGLDRVQIVAQDASNIIVKGVLDLPDQHLPDLAEWLSELAGSPALLQ